MSSHLLRRVLTLSACLGLVFTFTVPAAVQAAPVSSIMLSATVGPPTSRVTVTGTRFQGNKVDILFDATLVATTTPRGGQFSTGFTVPADALPGSHVVSALGPAHVFVASTAFVVRTDWPQFGFNMQQTRYNPYENVLSPNTVSGLALAWAASTAGWVDYASPVVANGIVYVGSSGATVQAFDATTGTLLWTYRPNGFAGAYTTPTVSNGIVYVNDGDLHALDARTGAVRWSTSGLGGMSSSPTVVNGIVYLGAWNQNYLLYALNATNGSVLWSAMLGNPLNNSPAVVGGVVYIGADKVYAFDAQTGALRWSTAVGSIGFARSSPTIANGVLYEGSANHKVYALNTATGAVLWTFTTNSYVEATPAVANGVVYIGSQDYDLYALDANTGALEWTASTGNWISSSAAVANGVVYVGSQDGKLYAFNAVTGVQLWAYTTGDYIFSSPTVVDGAVYVGSGDAHLYAFHIPSSPAMQ